MAQEVEIPTNDSVAWDGTRIGLIARLAEEAERLTEGGEASMDMLFDALDDPERFVTAHVLLTRITGITFEAFPDWNGLSVELTADGQVRIDPDQRHNLARRWALYRQMDPRPDALPNP